MEGTPSDSNICKKEKVMVKKKMVNIGIEDLEELERVMCRTKNERILKFLQADLASFRSKYVTKVINDSFSEDIPLIVPVKKPFDEKKYLLSNIRGYEKKVEAVKSCHPNVPEEKIIDTLIRFNGNEEQTIEGLFSDDNLPPFPTIPKKVVKKHTKNQTREINVYKERKKAASRNKPVVLLTDITKKSTKVDLRRRMEIIDFEKRNVENIISQTKPLELQVVIEKEELEKERQRKKKEKDSGQPERLFLVGEEDAIRSNTPRMFTFRPERTFSNEISHVHFRVAESQFYRMVSGRRLKIVEVKYIVTPKLIKRFEKYKRRNTMNKKKKMKQYLLHSPHNVDITHGSETNVVSNIRLHNYPADSFRKGRLFTSRREICSPRLFSDVFARGSGREQTLVLSLVVTGNEFVKGIDSSLPSKNRTKDKKMRKEQKKMNRMKKKKTKGAFGDLLKKQKVKYFNYIKELNLMNEVKKKKKMVEEEENENEEYEMDFDSIVDPSKDCVVVFNQDQVLPLYLVKYSVLHDQFTHLAGEWNSMKDSATADKQQEEIKKTYLTFLEKKEKDMKDKLFYETFEKKLMMEKKDDALMEKKEEKESDKNIVFESDEDDESDGQFQSPGSPGNDDEADFNDDDDDDDALFDSSGSPNGDDSATPVFEEDSSDDNIDV